MLAVSAIAYMRMLTACGKFATSCNVTEGSAYQLLFDGLVVGDDPVVHNSTLVQRVAGVGM